MPKQSSIAEGKRVTTQAVSISGTTDAIYFGLPQRIAIFSIILLLLVGAVTWQMVNRSQSLVIEYQARELAEVVARLAATARSVYAKQVVRKLHVDGFGAHGEYSNQKGYVPLPAQFLKMVGEQTSSDIAGLYRYKPISKWNLESSQGLSDDFKRWAWAQLERQDETNPKKSINWQPIWRIEDINGVKTLRYLRADPAVGASCVECHNQYEQRPEIIARRQQQGIEAQKKWELNQLLGAIEVDIPLNKVEALAQNQINQAFFLIIGVVVAGLLVIGFFVFTDVTRARSMAKQLTWQASHDGLTGLVNRTEFERRLASLVQKARNDDSEHALMFLDLDQFKIVNDSSGHIAGDELLHQLAHLLKNDIRIGDTLARLGGDEFGVLLENCSLEDAKLIAEKMRQTVRHYRFSWESRTFDIGVSIGLVTVNKTSESVAVLMSAVDIACYAAKDAGRNRVKVLQHTEEAVHLHRTEIEWASSISTALEKGTMLLAVQDAVSLQGHTKPRHYQEILLRMNDDNGNLVSTEALINAAERYNLMPSIDRWVIRTTFKLIKHKIIKADEERIVAINLSGTSLNDPEFLEYVRAQFWEFYEVSPTVICFEITETAAISNLAKANKFIRSLRYLGCHFALDDFGSGLSSFGYLKNLPVDFLKIDGKFVRDIIKNPLDRAMVEATVKIGNVMGIPTIAEWVENERIFKQVRRLDVNYAQGYFIEKPQIVDLTQLEEIDNEPSLKFPRLQFS